MFRIFDKEIEVSPDGDRVNATDILSKFPEIKITDWLEEESTQEYVEILQDSMKCTYRDLISPSKEGLIVLHLSVAVHFKNWIYEHYSNFLESS